MPLIRLPNGNYANVAEGTPPDVVERIKKANPAKRQVNPERATKPVDEIDAVIARRKKAGVGGYDSARAMTNAATFGLADLAGAGVSGLINGVREGRLSAVPEGFRRAREIAKREKVAFENESPGASLASNIVGAVASPVGATTGAAKVAARFAPKAKAALDASRVGRIAAKIGNTTVGQGARAGGNYAVLEAGVNGDIQDLPDAVNSYIGGAGIGALGGALVGGGSKLVRAFKDRSGKMADNVAYAKVADMLDQSPRPGDAGAYTPRSAQREIAVTDARGGDAMVADLSPGLRSELAYLSRKPTVRNSSKMVERAESRFDQSAARFDTQARSMTDGAADVDKLSRKASIRANQKADAEYGYRPEVIDKRFVWNDALEDQFRTSTPALRKALNKSVEFVRNTRMDPKGLGYEFNEAGDVVYIQVPNMRVLDQIKKGFDAEIGTALRSGDRSTAKMLSDELTLLKANIGDSNPQYWATLAAQRDFFQQSEAVDLGASVLKRLKGEPRELLAEVKKLTPDKREDLVIGLRDALVQLHNTKDAPATFMRTVMRSPEQRAVIKEIVGDGKKIAQFNRFIKRELRAAKTDKMTREGQQSATNMLTQRGEADAGDSANDALARGAQGFGFGGTVGALSNLYRAYDKTKRGIGPAAQEKVGDILSGKGDDLVKGVRRAKAVTRARRAKDRRAARTVGKVFAGAFDPVKAE